MNNQKKSLSFQRLFPVENWQSNSELSNCDSKQSYVNEKVSYSFQLQIYFEENNFWKITILSKEKTANLFINCKRMMIKLANNLNPTFGCRSYSIPSVFFIFHAALFRSKQKCFSSCKSELRQQCLLNESSMQLYYDEI